LKLGASRKLEALFELSAFQSCLHLLQLPFGLALRKVAQFVILGRDLDQPIRYKYRNISDNKDLVINGLTFNVRHSANVIFGGEHKLVIDDPVGFVVEASRGVQLHNLIILDCEVVACSLQVSNLQQNAPKFNFKHKKINSLNCISLACMKKPLTRAFLMLT